MNYREEALQRRGEGKHDPIDARALDRRLRVRHEDAERHEQQGGDEDQLAVPPNQCEQENPKDPVTACILSGLD